VATNHVGPGKSTQCKPFWLYFKYQSVPNKIDRLVSYDTGPFNFVPQQSALEFSILENGNVNQAGVCVHKSDQAVNQGMAMPGLEIVLQKHRVKK